MLIFLLLLCGVPAYDSIPHSLKIEIEGNSLYDDSEILETAQIQSLDRESIEMGISRVLKKYERAGYPFACVKPSKFHMEKGDISFVLKIDEGIKFIVDDIRVEGNTTTKKETIKREFNLRPMEVYNPSRIERAIKGIDNLGFIRVISARPVSYETDSDKGFLLVSVEELSSSSIEGILGYSKDRLSGFANIEIENLFGTGRGFSAHYFSCGNKSISLAYREPWLLGYPIDFVFKAQNEVFDTLYMVNRIDGFLLYSPIFEFTMKLGLEWKRAVPGSSEWLGITGIEYNGGIRFNFSSAYTASELNNVNSKIESSFRIKKRQNLFVSLSWEEIFRDSIPDYELIRLGGSNTVRGYEEGAVKGRMVVWGNIEYRFSSGSNTFFPFLDIGYVEKDNEDGTLMLGKGVGLSFQTPVGRWSVDYGIGRGDSFVDGKVHLSVSTRI